MARTRSIFSVLYVILGRPERGSSARLSLPSLTRAAHLATLLYFGAWLPFANTSSSVMVCSESLSLARILIYAQGCTFVKQRKNLINENL